MAASSKDECKHCGLGIRISTMTMVGSPQEWVHDPGGYHLCHVDGKPQVTGTRAEPA
jgi:hypothetical protein